MNQANDSLDRKLTERSDQQFSIGALFWLLTSAAIVVALFGKPTSYQLAPNVPFWRHVFWLLNLATAAILVIGFTMLVRVYFLKGTFLKSPGHLLLLTGMVFCFGDRFLDPIFHKQDDVWSSVFQFGQLLQICTVAFLSVLGWFRYRGWWRLYFITKTLKLILVCVWLTYPYWAEAYEFSFIRQAASLAQILMFVAVGISVVAVILDFAKSERHNWMHWFGVVGMWLTYIPTHVLLIIAARYLTPQQLYGF